MTQLSGVRLLACFTLSSISVAPQQEIIMEERRGNYVGFFMVGDIRFTDFQLWGPSRLCLVRKSFNSFCGAAGEVA